MTNQLRGNCTTDENPDAWFPTIPPTGGNIQTIMRNLAPEVRYAIGLCSTCPVSKTCLEEGMKPENLAYGIWGGLLPAQRIAIAKEKGIDYRADSHNKGRKVGPRDGGYIEGERKVTSNEEKSAMLFMRNIRPYLEV